MARDRLAHIEIITKLSPIEGKDRIELATVLGWQVIVKKGEFQEGDKCVFFEIDSLLPESNPNFKFMEKSKFRVKTMRMAGVISQGLVLSPTLFGNGVAGMDVGADVTEILQIKKYEKYEDVKVQYDTSSLPKWKKKVKYYWPWFFNTFLKERVEDFPTYIVPKTDETRIQAIPEILDTLKGQELFVTEKLDGQSATYILLKRKIGLPFWSYKFIICSRNLVIPPAKDSSYTRVAKAFDVKKKLIKLYELCGQPKYVAVQGEVIGAGIQGNKYKRNLEFYVFNLFSGTHDREDCHKYEELSKSVGFNVVPRLPSVPAQEEPLTIDYLVQLSGNEKSVLNPDAEREGIVLRTKDSKHSFKVINPNFLLKYDE